MSGHRCFAILFTILCCGFSRTLVAQDWQPVNQDELTMTADPAHPYDAIILYHEEISDDMRSHGRVYKRVKILTEKGKAQANVAIEYDAENFGVSDVKARSIAPDGTITPFSGKVFDSVVVKGKNLKYLAKTFTIPNVQVGGIIEWKYATYWDGIVTAPHWTVQEDLPQKSAKFVFVPLIKDNMEIIDSRGRNLDQVYSQPIGLPANTQIKPTFDHKLQLELKDIPAFVEEDFSPPPYILKMHVDFYYGTGKMGKPADFWREEGKYWSKEVEKFIGHSSAVAAAASQAAASANSPEQKVRKIYAAVQKIKNMSYASEPGSIDEAISRAAREKRTIDDVISNNQGYRDELTRLFVAMVRSAGIPAYAMRVADRDKYFFQTTVPNPHQLTSEIAIVTLGGKDIFLDPGTPMCPFGLLAWPHSGTHGLRQLPGGSADLAITEPPSYKQALSKRVARMTLAQDGSLQGTVIVVWALGEALVQRLGSVRTDEAGRKKNLEDEVRRLLPNGSRVDFVSVNGWDDPDAQISATFKVEVPSFASAAGKRMMVPTGLFEASERQPFTQERKNPVYFDYPYYAMDDVQIVFPAAWRVESMSDSKPVNTDFALYHCEGRLTTMR